MIPKGLFVAVIVGVSAAIALGVYLEKTYDTHIIKFVNGPSISVTTDKQDYRLNDQIKVQIINTGTGNVIFSGSQPSLKVRALDGTEFYTMSSDGIKLAPKEKLEITWNQQKNDHTHVLEGRYVLESFAISQDTKVHGSTTVNILR